jgi:cytochrome P450
MALLSPTQLTLSLIALFLTRRVWWEFTAGAERRALKKKHGCLPPQASWSGDPLGFGWMLGNFKSYSQHRILDSWKQNLADHNAHTLAVKVLAKDIFITDDPENVKTILATDFKIWSLGQERIQQLTGYIGKGIFTNEGPAWKHSREMLRPCFERSMVSDVSRFEKHTQRLIQSIPKDGSTVDLDPLFHRLTLDISTEFLFGRSTDSLLNRDRADVENFMEAFEYCQNIFENENTKRWGFIGIFLPDSKFKQHAKVIEGMYDLLTITSSLFFCIV